MGVGADRESVAALGCLRFALGVIGLLGASLASLSMGCSRSEPPTPDGSASVAVPELPAPSSSADAVRTAPGGLASPSAATAPQLPDAATPSAAPTASVDSGSLPQTTGRPQASGATFDARVVALWSAIVNDDPQQALPFFFPLGAYQQVKDVPDPGSDWKHRLVAAFTHDIHALHGRLGGDAAAAKLIALEVPDARGRWVEPGEEYNKIGYYRVFGSRLRYAVGDAHDGRFFEVKSLISWRGEWYVVHLSAIK